MRRKYKNLCLLGSGLALYMMLSCVFAADAGLQGARSQFSAESDNIEFSSLSTLPEVLLADASSRKYSNRKSSSRKSLNKKNSISSSSNNIKLQSYNQLDDETERLLKDILNLSSDLAILEEEQNTPAKHQLLVLVTMKPSKLFKLDYVELKIDNHTVAAYNYTLSDVHALSLGGGHRLYLALLPAGMHKLSATMAGRIPRDPDYNKAVNYNFVSGLGRTVVELIVSSEQSNSFPILAVKEWN